MLTKVSEQLEFTPRQCDGASVHVDLSAIAIDDNPRGRSFLALALPTPLDGSYPRDEILGRVWMHRKVVEAAGWVDLQQAARADRGDRADTRHWRMRSDGVERLRCQRRTVRCLEQQNGQGACFESVQGVGDTGDIDLLHAHSGTFQDGSRASTLVFRLARCEDRHV